MEGNLVNKLSGLGALDPMLWKKVSFTININGKLNLMEGEVCKVTNTDYWVCNRSEWYCVPKESVSICPGEEK
jgi:hypothetical protein